MFAVVTPEYFLRDGTRVSLPNLDGSETIAAYCGGSAAWKVAAQVSYLSLDEADSLAKYLTSVTSLEEEAIGDAVFHGDYNVYGIRNAEPESGGYVSTDLSLTLARAITVWMRSNGWAQAAVRYQH